MADDQQTYVITGAASGIGWCLADVLVARGERVVATDIDLTALAEHAEANAWPAERTLVRQLDVRDPKAWAQVLAEAVDTFGNLDVLINNAGYVQPAMFQELDPDQVHRHIDVNTKGVIFGTQAAARVMVPQGRGHIINVGSFAALAPIPGIAVYTGSKYAVRGFSLAVAHELRPFGVYVSVFSPESVQTPMLDREKQYDEGAIVFAAPRLLTVDEVAGVILDRVLGRRRRPLEVYQPRHRGILLRLADLFPRFGLWVFPMIRRRGLARLQKLRGQ